MRASSLALVLVLACAAPVRADAVPPPPDDCPRGSTGRTGHGGTHCEPTTCSTDADCGAGRVCREVALCIRDVDATFNTYSERPARETFRVAVRECSAGPAACPADAPAHIGWDESGRDVTDATGDERYRPTGPARCITEPRCVPSAEPRTTSARTSGESAAAAPERSSGCAVRARSSGTTSAGIVIAFAMLAAAMLAAARRRRRVPA